MKTNRTLSVIILSMIAVFAINATVKKSPEEVKIYINPGHGAFNGNCRPMGTVKHGAFNSSNVDTTGFFESNTNLWKGLALFHKLKEYGVRNTAKNGLFSTSNLNQGVMMSHISCGVDRALTEIAAEVEQYQPDVFLSIHSNASPDGSIGSNENYPLLIYRGEDYKANASPAFGDDTFDYVTGSYELGKAIWPHLVSIEHEPYTEEWKTQWETTPLDPSVNVRGDVDFMYYLQKYINNKDSYTTSSARGSGVINSYSGKKYYGYYGVLKHGYVGILSEGYMHTYYPSVNRHMNRDVCAIEGIAYAHGIADYFGWEKEKVGYIYGIVRDRNNTFNHTYYIPNQNSDDIYKPLNNVTVSLYKDGKLIDTYITDDEYNGAFVFKNLEPGDYTLDYSCAGYAPASEALKATVVTVKANEISYPKAFLSQESFSMTSGVSMSTTPVTTHSCANWYGGSSTNKIYPRQIAVSNDVVYLIMVGGSRISYWNAATGSEGSFVYGTAGTNGHGICTDDEGNLIFASSPGYSKRVQQVTVLPKSSGPGVVVSTADAKDITLAGKYNTVLSGGNAAGTTTTNSSGITNIIRASGNCYNGTGALWFTNGLKVVKIPVINGIAQSEEVYTTPLTDSSFSGSFGGSHNEEWSKESSFFPYTDDKYIMINRNGMFLCNLSGNSVDGFEYVENTWFPYNSSDIEYIGGHEIIVHQSGAGLTRDGKITVVDRTTNKTLASSIDAYGSAATLPTDATTVNAWCEFDIINNSTLALYTYVPNNGLAKYLINYTDSPDESCENLTATANIDNSFNQEIIVSWKAHDSWTIVPTNYLVKYQTSYVNRQGETIESSWQNADIVSTTASKYVHHNVKWIVDNGVIYPLNYKYKVIPNFNYYDGAAAISNSVEINFAAPAPEITSFELSSASEGKYDAIVTWKGVNIEGNEIYNLSGYNITLLADDTEDKIAIISLNNENCFGLIDDNGEGQVLDNNGNEIPGLTYTIKGSTPVFNYKHETINVMTDDNKTSRFTLKIKAIFIDNSANEYATEAEMTIKPKIEDVPTNIDKTDIIEALELYPIPAQSIIYITSPEAIEHVKIYSITGSLIKELTGNGTHQITISIDDFIADTYLIVVNNLAPKKFIKI